MSALSFSKALRNGSSALALSTIAMIGAQPALATPSDAIFGGGSTLASLTARQVGDCYANYIPSEDSSALSFNSGFNPATPTPGWLPTTCPTNSALLLYAGVGSSAGLRGYVSNDPVQLFRGAGLYPAANPNYDFPSLGGSFASYPYPSVDFGAGDSPLPENLLGAHGTFTSTYSTTTYAVTFGVGTAAAGTTSYPTGSFGAPIQLPLFEAPVAVAVNLPAVDQSTGTTVAGGTTWTIKSQFSTTAPGGRIQLSTAQVCAIFSGLVTDWSSTTTIPTLLSNGTNGTESFADANTWHASSTAGAPGTGGGTAYAGASTQIKIVYRSDGSGTSFIFTNYLKTVCPLLDPSNSYGYVSIFSTSALPNNNFTQLINKVTAYGRSLNTIGADGSDAVAAAIGNSSANYGYIGYLSNDFVAPYNPVTATRPHSASLQNDSQRANSVTHPGVSSTNFIAATPTSADAAWAALATYGVTPSTSWDFNDYNVYAKTFPATTYLPGSGTSVDITGRSILPLANDSSAYPAVGTAYIYLYSCYNTEARAQKLVSFLEWFYNDVNANSKNIVSNNGFGPLASGWVSNIRTEYLQGYDSLVNPHLATSIYDIENGGLGCTGVTGGAQ